MKNKIKNENEIWKINRDYYGVEAKQCKYDDKILRKIINKTNSWDYQNNDLCVCRAVLETVSSNAPLMNNFPRFALCENNFIEDIFCIICSPWVSVKK